MLCTLTASIVGQKTPPRGEDAAPDPLSVRRCR